MNNLTWNTKYGAVCLGLILEVSLRYLCLLYYARYMALILYYNLHNTLNKKVS